MSIYNAIDYATAKQLEKAGLAVFVGQSVLWVRRRRWKKEGRIYVYTWDSSLAMYIKPYASHATIQEWEAMRV